MSNYVVYENRPYTSSTLWKRDLRKLMRDFCIPQSTCEQIIAQAEQEAKPTETSKQVYNRAWMKFREHLLAN